MVKKDSLNQKTTNDKATTSSNGFSLNEFANETKEELSKVAWPSRQQVLSESAAVVLMVSLVATVIYLVDNFFAWGAAKVF